MEATSDRSAAAAVALAYQRERGALLAYLFRLVEQRETAEDLCQETFLRLMIARISKHGWVNSLRSRVLWPAAPRDAALLLRAHGAAERQQRLSTTYQ